MKHLFKLALPLIVLAAWSTAHAGKVEDVQAEVKKSCGKDISSEDALRYVKDLYLNCKGGTVDLEGGCKAKCLAGGAVVGQ